MPGVDVRSPIADYALGMKRARTPRVLVVSRFTAWETMLGSGGRAGIRALERERPAWFRSLVEAHTDHVTTLDALVRALRKRRILPRIVHSLDGADLAEVDLVVTAGGDGTVLYASHSVDATPMLGVRSSRHSAGWLTGASLGDLEEKIDAFMGGTISRTTFQRMSVFVAGRLRHDKVLNDALYSHPNPAVTTRYVLEAGGRSEEHVSSGVWVGPAAGSTAAIRSAGGRILPPSSTDLQFVVREPITGRGRRLRLLTGLVPEGGEVRIVNRWQPARLYLDGPHLVVKVRPGQTVAFRMSARPLTLLGWSRRRPARLA